MTPSNPHWLALDLSGSATSWALGRMENNRPQQIFKQTIGHSTNHSEAVISTLIQLFEKSHLSLNAVEKLLVTSGPGSYTGLRVALSTLKAFSLSRQFPIVTLSSHEAKVLAYAEKVAWELPYDHIYCVSNLSMNRYVSAHYRVRDRQKIQFVRDSVITGLNDFEDAESALILTEDETLAFLIPKEDGVTIEACPFEASFLLTAYEKSAGKREYQSLEEVISLTPTYYGESFKPPVKK